LIAEIRGAPVEKPGRSRQFDKGIFEKAGIRHACHTAARTMTVPAAVGVGRAILAGMDVIARVVRRRRAMVVMYQFRLRVLDSQNISNPLRAMREESPLR